MNGSEQKSRIPKGWQPYIVCLVILVYVYKEMYWLFLILIKHSNKHIKYRIKQFFFLEIKSNGYYLKRMASHRILFLIVQDMTN